VEFLIVLSKNLKILRIKKDVSQEFLSKKIGVSIQTINKWENDKCLPDAYNLLTVLHSLLLLKLTVNHLT